MDASLSAAVPDTSSFPLPPAAAAANAADFAAPDDQGLGNSLTNLGDSAALPMAALSSSYQDTAPEATEQPHSMQPEATAAASSADGREQDAAAEDSRGSPAKAK